MSWLGAGLPSDGDVNRTRQSVAAHHEERRAIRTRRLCGGSLACDRCDAPVIAGDRPLALTDMLCCPLCGRQAPAREFLTLGDPARPARVAVHIGRLPARPR